MLRTTFLASLGAIIALAVGPAIGRADHDRPFKGSLKTTVTEPPTLDENGVLRLAGVVSGKATIVGKITGSFVYYVNPDFSFTGTITKVAANGDEIHESFVGWFTSATASEGQFEIQGGTGRFAGATGGGDFTGSVLSDAVIAVDFTGTISRPK